VATAEVVREDGARHEARTWTLVRILRVGILVLALFSVTGLTFELLFLRHWGETRTIVWIGVAALWLALALLVLRPSRTRVRAAQALALTAGLVALVGLGFHTKENLDAGPLDRHYADRWDSMSTGDQLFAAFTGAVGPAPTLAPGALAQVAVLILLASLGQPSEEAAETKSV
jgi:hypothetical protein